MKKFQIFLLALMAVFSSAISAKAEDVTITLNIDNPAAVNVKVNNVDYAVVAGVNVITVPQYTTIIVSEIAPYSIKSVVDDSTGSQQSVYSGSWYCYSYSNASYTITTYNQDEARTASCNVNVDDCSKVKLTRLGTYTTVTLANGDNTVKFDPDNESQFFIEPANYGTELYQVILDGDALTPSGTSYYVNVTNGCNVEVKANFPDIDYTVSFSYSEEGEGAISQVSVNGVSQSISSGSFTAKAGSKIEFTGNTSLYNIEQILVNGVDIHYSGYSYSFILKENTSIAVTAHPYGTITATVEVDDPSTIIFYRGYSWQGDAVSLEPGTNSVELSETNTYVSWAAANGCIIRNVYLNDEAQSSYTTGLYLQDGDELYFDAYKIVYDKKMMLWVDDRSKAYYGFNFQGNDNAHTSYEINTGYNEISYYDGITQFNLGMYSGDALVNKVYVNDQLVDPTYEGGTSYLLDAVDGAVIKAYLATEPLQCAVDFKIGTGLEPAVTMDKIKSVSDMSAPMTVLNGTEFDFSFDNTANLQMFVNDTEVYPSNGVFTAKVEAAATTIKIVKNIYATVNVNAPEGISLYFGEGDNKEAFDAQAGSNSVNVTTDNNYLSWIVDDEFYIAYVNVNNQAQYPIPEGLYVDNGDEVVISVRQKSYQAVVWVNEIPADAALALSDAKGQAVAVKAGYNYIDYNADMNPFDLSWSAELEGAVYLNGEALEPESEDENAYGFSLAAGDVVKICLGEVAECKVTFDIAEGIVPTITQDMVTPVADYSNGISVLSGTMLQIALTDTDNVVATVNGQEIEPAEGVYTVKVTEEETTIKIAKAESGIGSINIEANGQGAVYNAAGQKVADSESQINRLPAGIYILNGKKTLKQ